VSCAGFIPQTLCEDKDPLVRNCARTLVNDCKLLDEYKLVNGYKLVNDCKQIVLPGL
jgi:hypothetical protein